MALLTDTHCHLNDLRFAGCVGDVINRAQAAGVAEIIVPGWDELSAARALALAADHPQIHPAVGLHPWFVQHEGLSWLPRLLDDPRVVAIGEIGLDGAIEQEDSEKQERAFRAQLAMAAEHDLPALLHCRHRWDRLLACLRDIPVRGVAHAFYGSIELLHQLLNSGLYISFAGMITRPNSKRAQEAATCVPLDRLLLETDAPNMALEGIPAEQVEPKHLPVILEYIARLRGDEPEDLATAIAQNVEMLFRFPA